jgi:hypothetical protein
VSYAKLRAMWSGGLATFLFAGVMSISPVAMTGCSGGDDDGGTTGPPPANPCNEASFSSRAEIGFNLNCSGSYTSNVSGITYDQFSRVIAYNYSISCGGQTKSGRVYNITYNNIGEALSWDYTVNGATCRKS